MCGYLAFEKPLSEIYTTGAISYEVEDFHQESTLQRQMLQNSVSKPALEGLPNQHGKC